MENSQFVESLINSWLKYIDIEDRAAASIQEDKITSGIFQVANKQMGISKNTLFLDKEIFEKIKIALPKKNQQDMWALSFPRIFVRDSNRFRCRPLFILDMQELFKGEYKEQGWDLSEFEFIPSTTNLQTMLALDDEEVSTILRGGDLLDFLCKTLDISAENLEVAMLEIKNKIQETYPNSKIENRPYLFIYQGEGFNRNLKKDFREILRLKDQLTPTNLAIKYIRNKTYETPRLFLGALGSFPPTSTQAQALYHNISNSITAVQGPPGSGKTSLIMNIVASQITKRALGIIHNKDEMNNITVITSTNKRAVNNAVEKLLELNAKDNSDICLVGGSQQTIQSETVKQIKKKIEEMEQLEYKEERYEELKSKIIMLTGKIESFQSESNLVVKEIAETEKQTVNAEQQCEKTQKHILSLRESISRRLEEKNLEIDINACVTVDKRPYFRMLESMKQLSLSLREGGLINYIKNVLLDRKTNLFREFGSSNRGDIEKTYDHRFPRISIPIDEISLQEEQKKVEWIIEILDDIERCKVNVKKIDDLNEIIGTGRKAINAYKDKFADLLNQTVIDNNVEEKSETFLKQLDYQLDNLQDIYHELFFENNRQLFFCAKELLVQHCLKNKNENIKYLERYLKLLSGDYNEYGLIKSECKKFFTQISLMFPVFSSTLQSVSRLFPFYATGLVDKVIVDEAGMIPCHQVFSIFFRANSAIVVGDPYQIEPVIGHSTEVLEAYKHNEFLSELNLDKAILEQYYYYYSPSSDMATAFYVSATQDFKAKSDLARYRQIQLKEHFRCQADIAQYFNEICKYNLEVLTPPKQSKLGTSLLAYNVNGFEKNKVNEDECEAVEQVIRNLLQNGYAIQDIGVISPYKVHSAAIKKRLKNLYGELKEDDVGTVHTFQGGQKKVMICSTKITNSRYSNFINRKPNLLNVAVSRAEELFILVGDLYVLRKSGSYLERLIEHIEKFGQILEFNPLPEIVQNTTASLIRNCEHLTFLQDALLQCKHELCIVTPWIREEAAWDFLRAVKNVSYTVKILYGWGPNDENDEKTIEQLKLLSHVQMINMNHKERGTHEKILICDEKYALIGSWNWLSHKYFSICKMREVNEKIIVRHELSVKIETKEEINELKKMIVERIKMAHN